MALFPFTVLHMDASQGVRVASLRIHNGFRCFALACFLVALLCRRSQPYQDPSRSSENLLTNTANAHRTCMSSMEKHNDKSTTVVNVGASLSGGHLTSNGVFALQQAHGGPGGHTSASACAITYLCRNSASKDTSHRASHGLQLEFRSQGQPVSWGNATTQTPMFALEGTKNAYLPVCVWEHTITIDCVVLGADLHVCVLSGKQMYNRGNCSNDLQVSVVSQCACTTN